MKRLYNDDSTHTNAARALDAEACALLNPLYERYLELGYTSHEITSVLIGAVFGVELGDVPTLVSRKADGK